MTELHLPLFHGGVRRLRVGDRLLPPANTGVPSCADYGAAGVCRRDRVYLTTELLDAQVWACMFAPRGRGWVYEAEPLGELEPDPDYSGPGASYAVPAARVVRIVERDVVKVGGLDRRQIARVMAA